MEFSRFGIEVLRRSIWYQRDFNYSKKERKKTFVYFGAVNYECHVYVNGKKLGKHIGGFGPFNFDATDALVEGKNFIVVRVKNDRRVDGVPTLNTDWWNHGGITRSVKLVEVPETFIQNYKVQLKKGSSNIIEGFVLLHGATEGKLVNIKIPELKVNRTYRTDAEGKITFSFPVKKLVRWDTENPKLYDVTITGATDLTNDRIGFRTIEVVV